MTLVYSGNILIGIGLDWASIGDVDLSDSRQPPAPVSAYQAR